MVKQVLILSHTLIDTGRRARREAKSEMKDFYELDDWKQCELPIELIERLGANHVRSLEALSEKEGKARPPNHWRSSPGVPSCRWKSSRIDFPSSGRRGINKSKPCLTLPHLGFWQFRRAINTRSKRDLEAAVSEYLGRTTVICLPLEDEPGRGSLRGYIERNAIAILSNFERLPIDPPSANWLGHCCPRARIRLSGKPRPS